MENISKEEILKLANLSSIPLDKEQLEEFQREIPQILDYVEQLSTLNTEGVQPTYQPHNLQSVWREDTVANEDMLGQHLLGLTEHKDNQIVVPKVI